MWMHDYLFINSIRQLVKTCFWWEIHVDIHVCPVSCIFRYKKSFCFCCSTGGNKYKYFSIINFCKKIGLNLIKNWLYTKVSPKLIVKQHTCTQCTNKEFDSAITLKQHKQKLHSTLPRKRFQCDQCSKSFVNLCLLNNHVITYHHGQRPYICTLCPKSFTESGNLRRHLSAVHYQIKHHCEIWGKSVATKCLLKLHVRSVHEGFPLKKQVRKITKGKPFTCKICPNSFKTTGGRIYHMEYFHKGKRYTCEICKLPFSSARYVKMHVKTVHQGQKPFKCSYCDKAFTSSQHLKSHNNAMHSSNKKIYSCSKCENNFLWKSALLEHLKRHENKTHQCYLCHKTFFTNEEKCKHQKTHRPLIKAVKCGICNKGFTTKDVMERHVKIVHLKKGTVFCVFCGQKCCDENSLFEHILRHIQEKLHQCDLCPRQFYNSSSKTVHMRTHTGEKLYKCIICEKYFSTKSLMQTHFITRFNTKPWQCIFCEKGFSSKTLLWNHMLQEIQERSFSCNICFVFKAW